MAAEMPVKATLAELAKPTGSATKPPPTESPAGPPEKPALPEDARSVLQKIAAGPQKPAEQATPATQATPEKLAEQPEPPKPEQASELGSDKEKVNSLLTQGAQLLLDAGDPRVAIAAVARSAAPTPLGTELRRDVLTMIGEMRGDKFPPEQRETLTKLQQDIEAMKLPKTDPARSEFARFLEDYSRQNPDKAIPPSVIEAIRTEKIDSAQAMTDTLKTDTGLSTKLWTEMKGDGTTPAPNVATADGLLKAAGLEATPENTAKVQKFFEPKGPRPLMGLLQEIQSDIPSILITASMITMLVSQFVTQEGGGGGHQ